MPPAEMDGDCSCAYNNLFRAKKSHSILWNKHYAQRADLYSGSKLLKSVVICEEYQDKNWPTRFREVHRLASQIDSECEVSDSVCNDDNDSDWEDDGEDDE